MTSRWSGRAGREQDLTSAAPRQSPSVSIVAFLRVSSRRHQPLLCLHRDGAVPSADEIQKWSALQPFVIQPSSITGVYQNIDIDSVVFHYSTRLTDPTAFWRELHNQARSSGWVHLAAAAETNSSREYETFQRLAPRGELWFSSAEELRVAYRRDRIVVGYVQSDQQGDRSQ